jgi:hypothetical protein
MYRFINIKKGIMKSKPKHERPHFPNYAIIIIVALAAISGTLVIQLKPNPTGGGGSVQTSSKSDPLEFTQIAQRITPNQDMTLSQGNTTLLVPAGATNLIGYLSLVPGEPNQYPAAGDPGWTRPVIVGIEYRDDEGTPTPGFSFLKPIEICFTLNDSQWQDYGDRLDAYQVEYYAENLGVSRWIVLPRVTQPDTHQLCGTTDFPSLFALAAKNPDPTRTPTPYLSATPTLTPTVIDATPTRRRDNKGESGNQPGNPGPPGPPGNPPPPGP